jgi:hypothetical protein
MDLKIFKETLQSCIKFKVPIIIVNDFSTKKNTSALKKYLKNLDLDNITLANTSKNLYITDAILFGLNYIKTDYTVRVDQDDLLLDIYENFSNYDIVFRKSNCTSYNEWLLKRNGIPLTGVIMKTKILKQIYENSPFMKTIEKIIPEDLYHFLKLLIFKETESLTSIIAPSQVYLYRPNLGNMNKTKRLKKECRQQLVQELLILDKLLDENYNIIKKE